MSAAAVSFPEADSIIGIDINRRHLLAAQSYGDPPDRRIKFIRGDFFKLDWELIVTKAEGPWLIVGNPPWVTSADLGAIKSGNLPEKSNFHGRRGIEAITGKSNFDISEWMILRYLDWLEGPGTIGVLCKRAVARKILLHIWKKKRHNSLRSARVYKIDALRHFGAAVDACFFVLETDPEAHGLRCDVFDALDARKPSHTFGYVDGHVIRDETVFRAHRNLLGPEKRYVWRSGVKHDCSKVMELTITPDGYVNGLGERLTIEQSLLFPMLKSSDIGNGRIHCRRVMVVTQQVVGQDTEHIKSIAPKTWKYLERHAALLRKRGSSIYKNRPAFSIFGVGPYTFAPWKVAISGFYKKLHFVKIGPVNGKPVIFDDTIYFLPCWSEEEASFVQGLLRSREVEAFFDSMIHWDEKRPITAEILKRLSIQKLAATVGREQDYFRFTEPNDLPLFDGWKPLDALPPAI